MISFDDKNNPPSITNQGDYLIDNFFISNLGGILIENINDVRIFITESTFYKCTNKMGGGICLDCSISEINISESCFVANYLSNDYPCGYAIRILRDQSSIISYLQRITTSDHKCQNNQHRDVISIDKGPSFLNEINCSNNHLNYRSFMFLRGENDQSYLQLSYIFNNSDINEHLFHAESIDSFHIKQIIMIKNKVKILYNILNTDTNIDNSLFFENSMGKSFVASSGNAMFYNCFFDSLSSYSGNIQFSRTSSFISFQISLLSTFLCPSSNTYQKHSKCIQINIINKEKLSGFLYPFLLS